MREGVHGVEVSIAIAEAAGQCDVDVVSAYPITPQTHVVEHLAEMVAEGELNAEFIPVESEHTAMSVCLGAAATGARTFTSTSSQGLSLMTEIVFIAASMRLPVVLALVNRTLSSPLSIWNDHGDIMSIRDAGWIHVFVENGQEAYDHVFWAFRVAEDKGVMLPVAINLDGFILSHVIEPIEYLGPDQVKKFLPPFTPLHRLDPDHPISMGAFAMPEIYSECKRAQEEALMNSLPVIRKSWAELKELTGREYRPVETYRAEGAKTLFVTMGSLSETVSVAVDGLREKGESVGQVRLRLFRPFPVEDFREAVKGADTLIVIDRAVSLGFGGPVAGEIRSVLYNQPARPRVATFVVGLSGRDVQVSDFLEIARRAAEKVKAGREEECEFYGVRE